MGGDRSAGPAGTGTGNCAKDGNAAGTEVFAEVWLTEDTGENLGRPVDVAQRADGSILVSDDFAGALYRISYEGK